NAHLEPAHLEELRGASMRAERPVALPDPTERSWALRLAGPDRARFDGHAGRYETGLVMAVRPELIASDVHAALPEVPVHLARAIAQGARTFEEAGGPQAYFGAPSRASRAEGEELYAILVEMVVASCAATWPGTISSPPPPASAR